MAFYGVYRGVVMDNNDPSGAGRVKVRVETVASASWALVVLPSIVGPSAKIPAGSTVVVAFEHGDPSFPVVLGRVAGRGVLPLRDQMTSPHS